MNGVVQKVARLLLRRPPCISATRSASITSSSLELSADEKQLQATARDFTECHVTPTSGRYDTSGQFPWDVLHKAFDAGLSTDHANLTDQCIVGEEIATGCSAIFATMATTAIAMYPITTCGSPQLKMRYMDLTSRQPTAAAFVSLDHRVTATAQGSGYLLKGPPHYVTNAGNASFYVVMSETDPHAPAQHAYSTFVVDKHWLGLSVGSRLLPPGLRCCDVRALALENVAVAEDCLVGKLGTGLQVAANIRARSALMQATGLLGIYRRCQTLLETDEYEETEQVRSGVREAAWSLDRGRQDGQQKATTALARAVTAAETAAGSVTKLLGQGRDDAVITKLIRDVNAHVDVAKTLMS